MSEFPPLNKGDTVLVHGWHGKGVVTGFRSGGMLVDVVSHASGQTFCVPRRQAEGGYLTATKERTCSLGWDCDDTLCDHGDGASVNPICRQCEDGLPVVAEIDGRVLVCARCRDDAELQAHARSEYR